MSDILCLSYFYDEHHDYSSYDTDDQYVGVCDAIGIS